VSDDRHQASECLDAETLAAFMDGRLEPRERAAVEAHLADCEDCYEVWMEGRASIAVPSAMLTAAPSLHTQISKHWRLVAGAAAILAVTLWLPFQFVRPAGNGVSDLVTAVGGSRLTEARLSDSFSWGPRPNVIRGDAGTSNSVSSDVLGAATALESGLKHDSSGPGLRARGIAALAARELDRSVELLGRALEADLTNVAVRIDLTAVLLERYRLRGDIADARLAESTIAPVVVHDQPPPAALFNHALVIEATRGREEAVAAWQRYLAVDSTSNWAQEAGGRIER